MFMGRLTTEQMLDSINNSPVEARWKGPHTVRNEISVGLILPHHCGYYGNVFVNEKDKKYVTTGTLRVGRSKWPEDHVVRGNGIGKRLVRSLGSLAQNYDYPEIRSMITSQHALDVVGDVYGEDRITFNGLNYQNIIDEMPDTFNAVRQVLVGLEAKEDNLERRQYGVLTTVDIEGLDMHTWEKPKEIAIPGFDLNKIR